MSDRDRPQLDKWYFRVTCRRDFMRMDQFTCRLDFALVKLTMKPPENSTAVHGKHYKGARFVLVFRVPAFVEQWR